MEDNENRVPFPMLTDTGGKVDNIRAVYNENAGVETRGSFICKYVL
jgi:hypothetical protein